MNPRYVKPGEMLAMAGGRLHHDRKGFFWMLGSGPLPNERKGDAIIVHVRGELEHHQEEGSCAESYEGILEKFRCAYAGESVNEEGETVSEPPKRIIMCVDSPGGVVSGLNECVGELQRMRAANPEIKVAAYVNEMATSAAYALACSCDEIVCPPSAIIGSIGVISTMISAAVRDKKDGFDVRLLTSGARKADGHLHAPISDDAVAVETKRVEKLADAFFRLAGKARGLSVNKIRALQAGIFLGKDAIREGLADRLMAYRDLLAGSSDNSTAAAGGNQTDRHMDLTSLIKKTKAALVSEDDPKKINALSTALASYSAALEAYKKTEKFTEKVKTEEGDDEGDDEEEPEEKASAEEEEKASSESEEKASAAAESEDDEDEAKSAKKAMALVQKLTGMKGPEALGALQALAMTAQQASKDVAVLKRDGLARDKSALIASAKGKYLTTSEATWLASQPMATVKGFVEMRRKSGVIVHTDESTILQPKVGKPGTEESLPDFTRQMIDAAVASMPANQREKGRAELVEAHLKAHNEQMSRALNGAAEGRY